MLINLNSRDEIATLDGSNVLGSIEQLPEQIEDAWTETSQNDYSSYAADIDHIVVAGMGGSALGAQVIKTAAKNNLKCPLEVVNDYTLPGYINDRTLVILSSYSGTTEETLAAAKQAEASGTKIAIITAGGDLASLAKEKNYPSYIINPKFNPSNQPRMAIGYAITGQIGLLQSMGLINENILDINKITTFLREKNSSLAPESDVNIAKELAQKALGRIIFLVSAEHLTGATHVMNNQLNENAKNMTVELKLPELNHHYMEGLPNPKNAVDNCIYWFINSSLYSPKLQLRVKLTEDVVSKNNFKYDHIDITGPDIFTQVFELIQLGAYTNFYLAMLHGINPAPIPWVDYFKDQLKNQTV